MNNAFVKQEKTTMFIIPHKNWKKYIKKTDTTTLCKVQAIYKIAKKLI